MDFLISPMINGLFFFYGILGQSFPLAIIVTTVIVRLITLPLTLPQQRSARKMQQLAPQLEEIKKKYGNDRQMLAQKQMELYKANNVNMFGGCLPLILQLFIMIAFYQAITGALALNPLQLYSLGQRVLPDLAPLIPMNSRFLWLDLGLPDQFFVLPILVVVTTYLSQKMMATPSADPSAASMTRQMNIMMPLMFGLFALQFASGLSIYFIVSNIVSIVQGWFVQRGRAPALVTTTGAPSPTSKASKPVKSAPVKAKK